MAQKDNSPLVLNYIDIMNCLAPTNRVVLSWVPRNISSIEGNEIADPLTKSEVDTSFTVPEPILKAPPSFFKGVIEKMGEPLLQ